MASVWTIALNAWEDALRRKVIYILFFVALLFGAQALYGLAYMEMAATAGEIEMLAQMRGQIVLSLFGMMEFWSLVLAVFLGSVAVSSEIRNRTIVAVLSRPVERWQFFLAKWLGTLAFIAMFLGAGTLVGVGLCWYWELYPSALFAFGIAELFVQLGVLSGVSLALSSFLNPVLAGGGALVLFYASYLTGVFAHRPRGVLNFISDLGYFLAPARMPDNLLESGLIKGVLDPNYGLYSAVLAENALYAVAAMVAGALVFQHREIAVK
jgi:ABC-2 type transport system permease protein